jgi:hypothetical protein
VVDARSGIPAFIAFNEFRGPCAVRIARAGMLANPVRGAPNHPAGRDMPKASRQQPSSPAPDTPVRLKCNDQKVTGPSLRTARATCPATPPAHATFRLNPGGIAYGAPEFAKGLTPPHESIILCSHT